MNFKILKRIVLCLLICLFFGGQASALSANMKIVSDDFIKVGETFTLEIKLLDDTPEKNLSKLRYDADKLEYISGGNRNKENGAVFLTQPKEKTGNHVYKLKFKAISTGNTTFKLDTMKSDKDNEEVILVDETSYTVLISDNFTKKNVNKTDSVEETENIDEDIKTENVDPSVEDKIESHNETPKLTMTFYIAIIAVLAVVLAVVVIITSKKRKQRKYNNKN